MWIIMGVDIGQKRDPTAICVAEREDRGDDGKKRTHFLVRHLQRLPLGTPYPDVVRRVVELADSISSRAGVAPFLYVDATGVGTPIVDLLREERANVKGIYAVYFTYGDRWSQERKGGYWQVSLGKALLVSQLQALLQSGRIHLPRSSEAEALAQELLDYEIRVDENANERYGAFKVGTHDDLVTALGIVVQAKPIDPEIFRPFIA